ncbi:MAG: addiction module protein [Proteobacteria bacterium]|nr:addiction module protein [Pseudomonadota bacterium]
MAISAKALYEQSLELDEQERTALVGLILENLEPADVGVEQAWLEEIEKRVSEMDIGTTELVSWESVRAKLSRKLNTSTDG